MSKTEENQSKVRSSFRGMGCLVSTVIGLGIIGFIGVSAVGLSDSFMSSGSGDMKEILEEQHRDATQKIVVVELNGVIMSPESGASRAGAFQHLISVLRRSVDDDSVAGILIQMNSPGGGVTASDILHEEIQKTRAAGKKIVAIMGDLCASGCYYAAVGADEIWAHPTSVTGSIGVILQSFSVKEFLDRHGVYDRSIRSGSNKQLMSPLTDLTDEQKTLLQTVVDELHERFVSVVLDGRSQLSADQMNDIADGRIFTARQAKDLGLVDQIGYRTDALDSIKELSGSGPFNVVRYQQKPGFFDGLLGVEQPNDPVGAALDGLLGGPRAFYLYGGVTSRVSGH